MMIYYKTQQEIEKLRMAGRIVNQTLVELEKWIRPGVTTRKLDQIAEDFIRSRGAVPGFKGYSGFPATLCVSVNEEVVHGIPGDRELRDGDLVSVDCGTVLDGYWGDHARSFPVGEVSDETLKLLSVTEASLYAGIEQARSGAHLGDIGAAVQKVAEDAGFSVVRSLVGHGVGRNLHEEPQVPNYGKSGRGLTLKPGLVIAIEPMVNMGDHDVFTDEDGWTIIARDRRSSAHFEHTIAITENGPEILTDGH